MARNKIYERIYWQNNQEPALNETNLNRMDFSLDALDDRVIEVDTLKMDKSDSNELVKDWSMDEQTGIITVTKVDGSTIMFDLNIEKIPVSFSLSEDGILTMTTSDGTKFTANIGAMIPVLTFKDSQTIAVGVSGEGVNKTYTFGIKAGSVTENMIQPNYLADIKKEVGKAQTASASATASADSADFNAKLSQSYAVGGSEVREGEDEDNAKYYKEQSELSLAGAVANANIAIQKANEASDSAINAKASEDKAKASEENAKTSETNASESEANAKASELNASESASNALISENNASASAESASTSATSASENATLVSCYLEEVVQSATDALNASVSASESAINASTSATIASTKALEVEGYIGQAVASAEISTESANTATQKAEIATQKASEIVSYAESTEANANKAEQYAIGESDSAKYYYLQAKSISESFAGALRPMGTIMFTNLPSASTATPGDMYDIADEFITTDEFKGGSGYRMPMGTNVYCTADGFWDCLAGSPVTGIKGAKNTEFRRGNVSISASDIGAVEPSALDDYVLKESGKGLSSVDVTTTMKETWDSVANKVDKIDGKGLSSTDVTAEMVAKWNTVDDKLPSTTIIPKADGTTITQDADGTLHGADTVPIATTEVLGKVKPDGTTITVDEDGTLRGATTVKVDNKSIEQDEEGEISVVGYDNLITTVGEEIVTDTLPRDADTLGGLPASDYALKTDLEDFASKEDVTEATADLAKGKGITFAVVDGILTVTYDDEEV